MGNRQARTAHYRAHKEYHEQQRKQYSLAAVHHMILSKNFNNSRNATRPDRLKNAERHHQGKRLSEYSAFFAAHLTPNRLFRKKNRRV
jgi:hypothetical protein